MTPEAPGDLGLIMPGRGEASHCDQVELRRAAKADTSPAGSLAAGLTALADHGSLELGKAAEHVQKHATDRRCCIQGLGQRPEGSASVFDSGENAQKVDEAAGETIDLVHQDDIAGPETVQQGLKKGPMGRPTAFFLEKPIDACPVQGVALQGRFLIVCGDPGVTEKHCLYYVTPWCILIPLRRDQDAKLLRARRGLAGACEALEHARNRRR